MPYLTPDQNAVRLITSRRISVYSEYWPMLIGAMVDCLALSHWEEYGDITPDQAVQEIHEMFIGGIETMSMVGLVFPLATAAIPDWMLECNNTVYQRVDYPALYDALDASFIVDANQFRTPDMRGRVPMGYSPTSAGTGVVRVMNSKPGTLTHTLTQAEMPAHTHSVIDPGTMAVTTVPPEGFALADPGLPTVTGSAGGGAAHNNVQPSLVLRFGIAWK